MRSNTLTRVSNNPGAVQGIKTASIAVKESAPHPTPLCLIFPIYFQSDAGQ